MSKVPCGAAADHAVGAGRCRRPLLARPCLGGSGKPLPFDAEAQHWPWQMLGLHGKLYAKLDTGWSLAVPPDWSEVER